MEFDLVGGAVRRLRTGEPVTAKSDYDVLVTGTDYKGLLRYLINKGAYIIVPEPQYIPYILEDNFYYFDHFTKLTNSNWTSYNMGVIKAGLDNCKSTVDYALARIDGLYDNDSVVPSTVIHHGITKDQDLARRDFRINAMTIALPNGLDVTSFNPDNIYDPYEGLRDIERRVINCVGDPEERFWQDGTRLLRLIKFLLRLDYEAGMAIKLCLDETLYPLKVERLIKSYKAKVNDDRTVQELKYIFNNKYNSVKAMTLFTRLLPPSFLSAIFSDVIFLNPTIKGK